jgi:hypothetical protein
MRDQETPRLKRNTKTKRNGKKHLRLSVARLYPKIQGKSLERPGKRNQENHAL